MVHSQLQSAHGPSHLHATWQTQIFALEPWSPRSLQPTQGSLQHGPHPLPSGSSNAFCGQSGRLYYWCWGCAVSIPLWASPPPSLHFFLPETDPCGAKLRHWKPGTAGYQVSLRRVASLAGGSIIPIHSNYWPQESSVPERCKTPQPSSSLLGSVFHTIQLYHYIPSWRPEPQSGCPLSFPCSRSTLRPRPNPPSSPHSQSDSVGHHRTNSWRHPHWTSSAGRPRGEDLRPIITKIIPSWLSSRGTGLWTPRQTVNSLTPPSSVLVAQYDSGCHQVHPQLLSLCPVQDAMPSPLWKVGSVAYSTKTSITTILIVLHPEAVAVPVVVLVRQEPPLGEGVMSGSLSHFSHHSQCSHHSHQHQRSPDPNPQITNHPHLLQLIKPPFISSLSTLPPRPVYRSHPWTLTRLSTCTYLCLLTLDVPVLHRSCCSPIPFLHDHPTAKQRSSYRKLSHSENVSQCHTHLSTAPAFSLLVS